jgi:hypothetical protein
MLVKTTSPIMVLIGVFCDVFLHSWKQKQPPYSGNEEEKCFKRVIIVSCAKNGVEETEEHLFFDCPSAVCRWISLGISWEDNSNIHQKLFLSKQVFAQSFFMEIFVVGARCIWNERNDLIFNRKSPCLAVWNAPFETLIFDHLIRIKPALHPSIKLVADGWCWFVLRERYCWLVVDGWFVLREKYCWLVANKPNEQGETPCNCVCLLFYFLLFGCYLPNCLLGLV